MQDIYVTDGHVSFIVWNMQIIDTFLAIRSAYNSIILLQLKNVSQPFDLLMYLTLSVSYLR